MKALGYVPAWTLFKAQIYLNKNKNKIWLENAPLLIAELCNQILLILG